jgi:hypothetical protein
MMGKPMTDSFFFFAAWDARDGFSAASSTVTHFNSYTLSITPQKDGRKKLF